MAHEVDDEETRDGKGIRFENGVPVLTTADDGEDEAEGDDEDDEDAEA